MQAARSRSLPTNGSGGQCVRGRFRGYLLCANLVGQRREEWTLRNGQLSIGQDTNDNDGQVFSGWVQDGGLAGDRDETGLKTRDSVVSGRWWPVEGPSSLALSLGSPKP